LYRNRKETAIYCRGNNTQNSTKKNTQNNTQYKTQNSTQNNIKTAQTHRMHKTEDMQNKRTNIKGILIKYTLSKYKMKKGIQ